MRISTSSMYSATVTAMNNKQVQIANTSKQLATGERILSPADDPVGAARSMELTLSQATNNQYISNCTSATNTLSLAEGYLGTATTLLQNAHTTVLSATDSLITDASRKSLAEDMRAALNDLIGVGNSTDGAGSYLFSGSQGNVKPFAITAGGVVYQGDDVQRRVLVAAARQVSSTDSGADIFMRIRNGNGIFQTAPAATNTGTGIITQGVVTNSPTAYNGDSYQVAIDAGGTTFSVTDTTTGQPVAGMTGVSYVSGQAISVEGIQFNISGTPAAGDTFNATPSSNESVFETLNKLIATLSTPLAGATDAVIAANKQALTDATDQLDRGVNAVLAVRATMGARLNELTSLQTSGDQVNVQLSKTLLTIQGTDYVQASTDLAQEKLALQAAQQSFAQVSKLSLFNFL
jgi:flagellar hook-associated protein 3 FlgL